LHNAWTPSLTVKQSRVAEKMVALMSPAMTFLSNRVTPVGARSLRHCSPGTPRLEEKWIGLLFHEIRGMPVVFITALV